MYLFLDTETTGLPNNYNLPYTVVDNWPRIVQIAWIIFDQNQQLIQEKNYIIKPNGFTISAEATRIHGISTKIADENGVDLIQVLEELTQDLQKIELIIAHNLSFDENIIGAEYHRLNMINPLLNHNKYCTMLAGIEICQIPQFKDKNKYKFPNLNELYYTLFNKNIIGAHQALTDVKACAECYWAIISKNKKKKLELIFDDKATTALKYMNGKQNIFLTGKAGTGKSTLLKYFLQNNDRKIIVLAPTGVAALNVGGSTIHSFFKFSTTISYADAKLQGRKAQDKKLFTSIKTIVIDEISMVRSDLLDCIDIFLQEARTSQKPFGGVQMIFVGDLYQLPPIVTYREKEFFNSYYTSQYFFDAHVFTNTINKFQMELIELEKIYRQNDQDFINILNAIRNKSINESHLQTLNTRVISDKFEIKEGYIYLTSKNNKVEEINQEQLRGLSNQEYTYHAEISGNFLEKYYPTDQYLKLKKGAQVMFVANDKLGRWVNGTVGKIIEIDDNNISVQIYNGEQVDIEPYEWEIKQYHFDKSSNSLQSELMGSFLQYPLTLAWAITIHKSQGKTFDKVIIDLGSGTFAHGQTYVALSRCTSLNGLSLIQPMKKSDIIMDWRIINFITKYHVLNQQSKLM